jgi:hypothetical protein
MKTYKELLTEKTRVRTVDLGRYNMLTMVLDGASKLAKETQDAEVSEAHLKMATRSLIRSTEATREMLVGLGKATPVLDAELSLLKDFLGPQMDETAISLEITRVVHKHPEEFRVRKNMKQFVAELREVPALAEADPKVINKILVGML